MARGTRSGPSTASGDEPPQHHMIEVVRIRKAFEAAARELGATRVNGGLVSPTDAAEAAVATLSFHIDGLRFAARVALLRVRQ